MSVLVGITQRVVEHEGYKERRDALAQEWAGFLSAAGIVYVPLPNNENMARELFQKLPFQGFILSGGNDIGEAKERDATERAVLEYSVTSKLPVIGVCRGMQMMNHFEGGALENIIGHIGTRHDLVYRGQSINVNSYHALGFSEPSKAFDVTARAQDGITEAMTHKKYNWHGIMWHPEREPLARECDVAFFKEVFHS